MYMVWSNFVKIEDIIHMQVIRGMHIKLEKSLTVLEGPVDTQVLKPEY